MWHATGRADASEVARNEVAEGARGPDGCLESGSETAAWESKGVVGRETDGSEVDGKAVKVRSGI